MKKETKPEMTTEEFADNWSLGPEMKKAILADLRSVMRGELIRFAQGFNDSGSPYILDGMIEKFLNNNQ